MTGWNARRVKQRAPRALRPVRSAKARVGSLCEISPRNFDEGMKAKNDPEAVRVAQVRQLFTARYPNDKPRTGNDVVAFFGWLDGHRPELLPRPKHGDPYQYLKGDLSGLYSD